MRARVWSRTWEEPRQSPKTLNSRLETPDFPKPEAFRKAGRPGSESRDPVGSRAGGLRESRASTPSRASAWWTASWSEGRILSGHGQSGPSGPFQPSSRRESMARPSRRRRDRRRKRPSTGVPQARTPARVRPWPRATRPRRAAAQERCPRRMPRPAPRAALLERGHGERRIPGPAPQIERPLPPRGAGGDPREPDSRRRIRPAGPPARRRRRRRDRFRRAGSCHPQFLLPTAQVAHVDPAHQIQIPLLIALGELLVAPRLRIVGIERQRFLEGLDGFLIQTVLELGDSLVVVGPEQIGAGILVVPVLLHDSPQDRNRRLVLAFVVDLDRRSQSRDLVGGEALLLCEVRVAAEGWSGEVEVLQGIDVAFLAQGLLRDRAQARGIIVAVRFARGGLRSFPGFRGAAPAQVGEQLAGFCRVWICGPDAAQLDARLVDLSPYEQFPRTLERPRGDDLRRRGLGPGSLEDEIDPNEGHGEEGADDGEDPGIDRQYAARPTGRRGHGRRGRRRLPGPVHPGGSHRFSTSLGNGGLGLSFLDSLEIETGRGLVRIERLCLEKELARRLRISGLVALSSLLEAFRHHSSLLGHFLPGLLDSRDRLGVVDVDQEDPGPDLDRLR